MALRVAICLCSAASIASARPVSADESAMYQQAIRQRSSPPLASGPSSEVSLDRPAITDKPWAELEKHKAVLGAVLDIVKTMDEPVNGFLKHATRSKAVLRATTVKPSYTQSGVAHAMGDALTSVAQEWAAIAKGIKSGLDVSKVEAIKNDDISEVFDRIAHEADKFDKFVDWFDEQGIRVTPGIKDEEGGHVVPAQLTVLKTTMSEFTKHKDSMVNTMNDAMEDLTQHLSEEVANPFALLGAGSCLDASGRHYQTFEKAGCESRFYCLSGCRKFARDQCRGVTFYTLPNGCGRCELRMEDGVSDAVDGWHSQWAGASGSGVIASANGTSPEGADSVTCYKRDVPEWDSWPSLMKDKLVSEMEKLSGGYSAVRRGWRTNLFKIDRAFWEVESGIDEGSAAILKLEGSSI